MSPIRAADPNALSTATPIATKNLRVTHMHTLVIAVPHTATNLNRQDLRWPLKISAGGSRRIDSARQPRVGRRDRYGSWMESPGHEPTLGDDDSLSLWVGRVARSHAHMEYSVDNIHRLLIQRAGHVPGRKSVKGFDQLVSECRRLLQGSDAD